MLGKLFSRIKKRSEEKAETPVAFNGVCSEMNYCPSCGDEYRAEQTICAACDMELISGVEKLTQIHKNEQLLASRSMEIFSNDELVTLRKGALKDVKHLQKLLAGERIPAILAGDEENCAKGCCGPEMYLQVRRSDAELAVAALNQDFIKSTALEKHDMTHAEAVYVQGAESTVCPACGCQFSPYREENCPECGLCFG